MIHLSGDVSRDINSLVMCIISQDMQLSLPKQVSKLNNGYPFWVWL